MTDRSFSYNRTMESETRLRTMYDAFNARDIDAVLDHLAANVDWPNAWEGGRVHGHDEVRDYWTRQWAVINAVVDPVAFTTHSDGSVAVEVDQVVRDLDGVLVGAGRVLHVYRFDGETIVRMDVEEPSGGD
jgi:ketosteroid isomerase-like protein